MGNELIFWSVYRRLTSFIQDSIKGGGADVTYLDMVVMDLIVFHGECTPSVISEKLGVAKSAVTVRLKRLEDRGYVTRKTNEKDHRSYVLALTEKGIMLYTPLNELFKIFDANLRAEFNEEELELGRRMIRCAVKM